TALLGAVFLAIKGSEYAIEYHDHLVPALNYSPPPPPGAARPPNLPLFMTFHFVMTRFHPLHMLIRLAILLTLLLLAPCAKFSPAYPTPVEISALYWHFVDLVWVFLYPTLYLLRHP